jgi:hypothetical protein
MNGSGFEPIARLTEVALTHVTLANTLALTGAILYVATLMVRTIVPLRVPAIIACCSLSRMARWREHSQHSFCI